MPLECVVPWPGTVQIRLLVVVVVVAAVLAMTGMPPSAAAAFVAAAGAVGVTLAARLKALMEPQRGMGRGGTPGEGSGGRRPIGR